MSVQEIDKLYLIVCFDAPVSPGLQKYHQRSLRKYYQTYFPSFFDEKSVFRT